MNEFIIRIVILAFSIYLVGRLTRIFYVEDLFTALISALLLALINMFIRPLIILLTLPLTILTLGLFLLLVNGLCLLIVAALVPRFRLHGCFTAALAALLISLTNLVLDWLIR